MGESLEQRLGRQELAAASGQFDGQRQPVQMHTDLGDGAGIGRGQLKGGLDGLRAQHKQTHRGLLHERLRRELLCEIGHREQRDWKLVLSGEVKGGPAGDEYAEARTGGEQRRELRCPLDHLLEVVQHEQQVPLAQRGLHLFLRGDICNFPQAECLGNGRHDAGRVADRGQRHEAGAIGEVCTHDPRDLQGQARFAHTASPRDGEQAHLWTREQVTDRHDLLFTTDQGGEGHGEPGQPEFGEICFGWSMCSCGSPQMRLHSGGSLSRRARFSFQTRHVMRAIPFSLARQGTRHGLQPLEGHLLGAAQVGTMQLAFPVAVGTPVGVSAPVAGPFFVRGEQALLPTKGESRGKPQPGIPAWGVHRNLRGVAVLLVGKDAILDDRRDLSHCCLPLLPSAPEQGFPNSIAHVRESLPEAFSTQRAARSCSARAVSRASDERKRAAKAVFHLFLRTRTKSLCSTFSRRLIANAGKNQVKKRKQMKKTAWL